MNHRIIILLIALAGTVNAADARSVLARMTTSAAQIRTLTYTFKSQERFDGKLVTREMAVKLHRSPFTFYGRIISPNAGTEMFYEHGKYDNKAFINTHGFPFFVLRMSPHSGFLREKQHHMLFALGFDFVASIISNQITRPEIRLSHNGMTRWDGRECHIITIAVPSYSNEQYTATAPVSIDALAARRSLSPHSIRELNGKGNAFDHVLAPGDVVTIPSSYAKECVLFIDTKTMLPIVQNMYDDKGLYERYEFIGLNVNPPIDAELTIDYKDYQFR